jgi:hypothetical protein
MPGGTDLIDNAEFYDQRKGKCQAYKKAISWKLAGFRQIRLFILQRKSKETTLLSYLL